jgi:UDP-glucose 4-epimerase
MKKILVTGGAGYIGSHTLVNLVQQGYDVISIDNFLRGSQLQIDRVGQIVNIPIKNYNIDLCDLAALKQFFETENDIAGIVHFAALKLVPESVAQPLLYYHNNISSLVNLLYCVAEYKIASFVFSSSCSVYGNTIAQPVTEATPLPMAQSPYGYTKQIGERLLQDFSKTNTHTKIIALRYFNPVGAHNSGLLGEVPFGRPQNLLPFITQSACGLLPPLVVHGVDYDTPDGSCVRDYVHVMDIAQAHVLALNHLNTNNNALQYDVLNLGTGQGISVLQLIKAFEQATGVALAYTLGPRREGDPAIIFANNDKAKQLLNWMPLHGLHQMALSAWQWQLTLNNLK